MKLRPHQTAAIRAIREAINRRTPAGLVALPTGTGKTVMFAQLAADLGWPTLILVHRVELVEQTERTFRAVWPEARIGIVHAERDDWRDRDVVIAMVPTLHARRLAGMPRDRFRLVVADEAHHAVADTWDRALDHFRADFILGVTATPERGDGRGLAGRFGERPLYSYGLRQAIMDKQLVRLRQYAIRTQTSLDGVAYRAGDFADADLSAAVNTPARNKVVVEAFAKHARGRRAVVFAVDVDHARALAGVFSGMGISAAMVSGETETDERRQLLRDFASGRIQVMTNCAVLTEGFDLPAIEAVLMARPTTSRGLYTQCVGRGLRLSEGKADCLVLDFADNSRRHKLVTALDLLGAVSATDADGRDVIQVADLDRERAERERIIESTRAIRWHMESVCPWPEMPTLAGYAPSSPWQADEATDKQIKYLESFGVQATRDMTKGEASHLIDRLRECEAAHPIPATPGQLWVLKSLRAPVRNGLTKREAARMIARLKSGQDRERNRPQGPVPRQARPIPGSSNPGRRPVSLSPVAVVTSSILERARQVAGTRNSMQEAKL